MLIRTANLKDLDLLTEMNIQLRADEKIDNIMTKQEVKERMRGFLQGNDYKAYIFYEKDLIYGYILIDHSRKPVYMRQIYIKKEFQNKGLGSKFFNLLIKKYNINIIDVEVLTWNQDAENFYKKIGFKQRYIGLRYKKS